MKNHLNYYGFTLIELVLTITILGVLTAFAIPRYFNFKDKAVITSVQKVSASLNSALILANSKVAIEGEKEKINYSGNDIFLTAGMPSATAATIRNLLNIDLSDSYTRNSQTIPCEETTFCVLGNVFPNKPQYVEVPGHPLLENGGLDRVVYIWPRGYILESKGCYTYYINKASETTYYAGSIVEGC
ncbi:type II secretion system protein [Vibrio mimicus]